ncbi:MAG TPA: hypothetical protein VN753_18100 [Terracidiphilus sp.]|jgi:hypothetical protein|nr:hypothetical protein [Terracidiphilus sp.]
MRMLLGFGVLILLIAVGVNAMVSSDKKEMEARLQSTLAAYRSALQPGTKREQVEAYLHQQNVAFTRSCCEPGIPSDRTDLGDEPRNLFCQPWKVSLEIQFKNSEPPADVAKGSDLLTNIDLHREGVCF